MKPSACSSCGFSAAAIARYSSRAPPAGKTSKMTAITIVLRASPRGSRDRRAATCSNPGSLPELLRERREPVELRACGAARDRLARPDDAVLDRRGDVRGVERRPRIERHDLARRAVL